MRKIYPPPFNKFVVFVFYSLLSIAVIVSAQGTLSGNECIAGTLKNNTNRNVVGYVQSDINPNTIRWELYNYINIIVNDYKNYVKYLPQFTNLLNARNDNGKNVQMLLSIRNYDLAAWNNDKAEKDFYESLGGISDFIIDYGFDGVDIEYPGMRGQPCGKKVTVAALVGFIKIMKANFQEKQIKKTIMLTVGSNVINEIVGLNGDIDLLNIETYHYSLYANLLNPLNPPNPPDNAPELDRTNPNSPYGVFSQAYSNWNVAGINKDKIIMGIDFGNTFQLVTNKEIINSPTVEYYKAPGPIEIPPDIKNDVTLIKNLCNFKTDTTLYSWPWKKLSANALDSLTNGSSTSGSCNTKNNWTRKIDSTNSVPWLYRASSTLQSNFFYFYVSYEDFSSLYLKLSLVGGISISDISYDDDDNSLLNYIHGNQIPPTSVDLPPKNPNSGKGTSPLNPTDSTNADEKNHLDNHKANAGVIVGAVLGGLLLVVVSCFVWYRRRSFLNSKNAGTISKSTMRSHTATKNIEMSSDSSPNRFAVPTTVIPVACGYVTAMFDFEGKEENDLSFKKGDKIEVLERGDGPNDWWVGRVNNTVGEFPGNYVKETG